jgi:hypothetical protein
MISSRHAVMCNMTEPLVTHELENADALGQGGMQ